MKKNKIHHIKRRFEDYHRDAVKKVKDKHEKALTLAKTNAVTLLGSAMLVGGVTGTHVDKLPVNQKKDTKEITDTKAALETNKKINENLGRLNNLLLTDLPNLDEKQEQNTEKTLSDYFNLNLHVTLDDNRLNRIWGYFGQEQHLYRWPGDNLSSHGQELEHGIAPATGAFGYFDNAEQEKYYIAAPIHLLPDWNSNWSTLKPWYKFRKVLVYNPKNGRAAVAVIGDAGPAKWTGKHFGGSPELMAYLDMYDGSAKSKAIVLFVDDKDSKIDLGPVETPYKVSEVVQTTSIVDK